MRKFTFITGLFTLFCLQSHAQSILNGGFETWTTTPYEEPAGYNTGNLRDLRRMGFTSVSKVTGQTGNAVRIETKVTATQESESYLINTGNPCADPPQWKGGVPYSQQPTAITGHYRYTLGAGDSALIIVIFRKNGAHIGDNLITFRGTGMQSVFTPFSFSLTCNGTPDSVIIAAASSNKKNSGGVNGSFLELDNLAFTGASQPIPNGNFEAWNSKSFEQPASWKTEGEGVTRSTGFYTGAYSVRLETTLGCDNGGNGASPGQLTSGYFSENSGPHGGRPFTNTTDTLCGYYKYAPVSGDKAMVSVQVSKNGSFVGGGSQTLTAASIYQYFELPFTASTSPDSIRVDFSSSMWPNTAANAGSVLYIDNVWLKSAPGLITGSSVRSNRQLAAYPNPASDRLYIRGGSSPVIAGDVRIYNALGQQMETIYLQSSGDAMVLDISPLPSGLYLLETNAGARERILKQ